MPDAYEMFEIVDEQGRVVGLAPRETCHGDPTLTHRVAHVLVCDSRGRLYLQKRSRHKDIQPGKWDTSVGGHLKPGESPLAAARRELKEELGISGVELEFLYRYLMCNEVESELVDTFQFRWEGPVHPEPAEIEEGRWWEPAEIQTALRSGLFTPNFEEEFQRWRKARNDPAP